MKKAVILLFILCMGVASKAQTVDYGFIKSLLSKSDSVAIVSLTNGGYTKYKGGEFKYVADNKVKSAITFVKANPKDNQLHTYWAFQIYGKKPYASILKDLKKGSVKKEGTQYGAPKTEYKSKDGVFYYPFADSMFSGLYWIYASKESLLD